MLGKQLETAKKEAYLGALGVCFCDVVKTSYSKLGNIRISR